MAPSGITTALATEDDAPTLAAVMTSAFAASDTAYPLIWSSDKVHADVAVFGLFSPVQQEHRITFKALDGERIVGFATWNLPDPTAPKKALQKKEGKASKGLPEIPGVNTALWNEKSEFPHEAHEDDDEPSEDMSLSFCFVLPDYQRRGIGTLLLQWGLEKADELKAKIRLTSTPQAVAAYEKSGWKVVQKYDIDLGKHAGWGMYTRARMLRQPK